MPADILIYALVFAGLVFWLRGILGTRHGDENQRPNPFSDVPERRKSDAKPPQKEARPVQAGLVGTEFMDEEPVAKLERHVQIDGPLAEEGLATIAKADKSFDVSEFVRGAQDAFVIIVEAFADKDKETLENLLTPPLYKAFAAVIDDREENGETASVEIHAVRKVDVLEAGVDKRQAFVTLRFVADETSLLRDKDDKLLFGNPERVTETRDIWTFVRDIRSRDPRWLLTATREDEDDEQNGSTVPDSKAEEKKEPMADKAGKETSVSSKEKAKKTSKSPKAAKAAKKE